MKIKRSGLISIIFCLLWLSPGPVAAASDITGTWTGQEDGGEPVVFVFTSTDWSYTNEAGDDWQRGTYTFNENSDPRQLDLYISAASDNRWITRTALFIYKIDGNQMTLSGSEPGSGTRPVGFSGDAAVRTFILTNDDLPDDGGSDHSNDDSEHDQDNVKVYVNCFITTLENRP